MGVVMYNVGIVGGGISSLHLGLKLVSEGEDATIFHPTSADQIATGRLMNSVIHQGDTVAREEALDIAFWDGPEVRLSRGHDHGVNIPGMDPVRFWGSLERFGRGVDYRLLLPRLMATFEQRGGTLVEGVIDAGSLPELQERFDLVAVGAGRSASGFADMFAEVDELNVHDGPARVLCCGLFDGVAANDPSGVALGISPVAGELVVLPMQSADGPTYALLFENIPGGPTAHLAEFDQAADPDGFNAAVLGALEEFWPHTFDRVDRATFGLRSSNDLLQGGFRPVVRRAYTMVAGRPVIAIGDLRVTLDPVTGAGANLGSFGSWTLAEMIAAHDGPLDEAFAADFEAAVMPRTEATVGFNNLILQPPEYFLGLLMEMVMNRSLCDEFTDGFRDPEHLWFDCVKDAETAGRFAASHR